MLYRIGRRPGGKNLHWQHDSITVTGLTTFLLQLKTEVYSMGMLPGEPREFGACDVKVHARTFEPRPEIRGDIARIYFYMDQAYPGHGILSRQNRRLFEAWSREDPVDDWERERARRIERTQGNANPFVR
jgi:deoxyribonuclease-1